MTSSPHQLTRKVRVTSWQAQTSMTASVTVTGSAAQAGDPEPEADVTLQYRALESGLDPPAAWHHHDIIVGMCRPRLSQIA